MLVAGRDTLQLEGRTSDKIYQNMKCTILDPVVVICQVAQRNRQTSAMKSACSKAATDTFFMSARNCKGPMSLH